MQGFTYDLATGDITGTLVVARLSTFLAQADGVSQGVIEHDDLNVSAWQVDVNQTPHAVVAKT